jgi:hypothetical protein
MTFRLMAQRMLPRNVVVSVVHTITSDASGGSASQCSDDRPYRDSDPVMPIKSVIGKFDRSGVSGSTGRGRSQALESKVRIADHTSGDANPHVGR